MTSDKPIYLDYAATTPVDPRVAEKMAGFLTTSGCFANPASNHAAGYAARCVVEGAREQVAEAVGAESQEIVWTSGATEADNLALTGAARQHAARGRHLVTVRTEHKAVLDTCKALEAEGFEVSYLTPERDGRLNMEAFATALRADTVLASVMHVNNEIGVVQDIAALGAICRERDVLFHVDAAQSAGKLPIDLHSLPVDMMSFSGHKAYGPKGIGALYVRGLPRTRVQPLMHGGGHERGLRSGTLATHQIVGMGEAFALAAAELGEEAARIAGLRDRLWKGLESIGGVLLNGCAEHRVPGTLNVAFEGVQGESLLLWLDGMAVSGGSACNASNRAPSYVLRALGRDDLLAQASVRFSLGRFTTSEEVDRAIRLTGEAVARLRELAPELEAAQAANAIELARAGQ